MLTGLISSGLLLVDGWSTLVLASEKVDVCNKGDVEVFYASLGVRDNFLSEQAIIQGLFSIEPGKCRNIIPGGMSDVTAAFFYVDKSGTLGNTVFKVDGPEKSLFNTRLLQICVHPDGFRRSSTRDRMSLMQFLKKWTPPCPSEYFPGKTSFGVWDKRDYHHTIDIYPSQDIRVEPFPPLSPDRLRSSE